MPLKRIFILIFISILLIPAASAAIQGLINSYNYGFYNGTINVTFQNDYMTDKNSNNKNDTLIMNITTDAASGTYKFVVEIIDENKVLINNSNESLLF